MTIPASEITRIQDDIEAIALPDTCNILSLTQVSDGAGGFTDTWGTVSSSIACRLDLFNSRGAGLIGMESSKGGALNPFSTWILTVPYGTSISTDNRIECNSENFNVVEVDSGRSWGVNVRATLEKI